MSEQGDATMPLLFAVGQHGALEAIHRRMNSGEFLMAFHDDLYITPPARVGAMYAVVQEELYVHAAIGVHHGKTKVWNQAGLRLVGCNALEQIARVTHPEAVVWTGSMIPTAQQGIKVLGTQIGHPDFVAAQLEAVRREHEVLLDRISSVSDLQCAWLLLVHCASARACCYLRTLRPSVVEEFVAMLTEHPSVGPPPMLRRCRRHTHTPSVSRRAWTLQCLAFQSCSSSGELGRLPPTPDIPTLQWSCWDNLRETLSLCLQEAPATVRPLDGVMGFEPPAWRAVMAGIQPEEFEPSQRGWQHDAASRVEHAHRETQLFPRMSDPAKALVRSHGGPGAGLALLICLTCRLTKLDPNLFRVVLLRRLQMPLLPTVHSCRCGRLLDSFGYHRAACARAGVLGKSCCALESVVARIFREAGGRVATRFGQGTGSCWGPCSRWEALGSRR